MDHFDTLVAIDTQAAVSTWEAVSPLEATNTLVVVNRSVTIGITQDTAVSTPVTKLALLDNLDFQGCQLMVYFTPYALLCLLNYYNLNF